MKAVFTAIILSLLLQAGYSQITLQPIVDSIPMRDGKKLAADIYLPDSVNKFPVILIMTPYNRVFYRFGLPLGIKKGIDSSNYAFVIVDWRCFYGSLAACAGQAKNGEDGYDVIDWISNQPWSNQKTGTWGPSALGKVQYLTAREQHPNHICAVPLVTGSQFNYQEYFPGGSARTEYIDQLDALGFGLSGLLYGNPVYNLLWQISENNTLFTSEIKIPLLMIGGWYDHNVEVMMQMYKSLQANSSAASDQKLLFGPWVHGGFGQSSVGTGQQGELFFPEAARWSDSLAMRFFNYWLLGVQNNWDQLDPVTYFQIGTNVWEGSNQWPPQNGVIDTLYLHDGLRIDQIKPNGIESRGIINYNPKDPSPTHGGSTLKQGLLQGPYDQLQIVESRNDILSYTSDFIIEPIIIRGKIEARLFITSDQKDTDFIIRLIDVYPDGRSMLINEQVKRMRFRNGFTASDTSVMVPRTVYSISLKLPELAYTFLSGHRLRLNITSSNYPRFDLNLNNGGPMYTSGDTITAINEILHEPGYSSSIILPVENGISLGNNITVKENPILKIHPNPSSGDFQLDLNMDSPFPSIIEIYSLSGKLVFRKNTLSNTRFVQLKVPGLQSGLYLVKVHNTGFTLIKKLLIVGRD